MARHKFLQLIQHYYGFLGVQLKPFHRRYWWNWIWNIALNCTTLFGLEMTQLPRPYYRSIQKPFVHMLKEFSTSFLLPFNHIFCIVFYYVYGRKLRRLLSSPLFTASVEQEQKFFTFTTAYVIILIITLYFKHAETILQNPNFHLLDLTRLIGSFVHYHQFTFHWVVIAYCQLTVSRRLRYLCHRTKKQQNHKHIVKEVQSLSYLMHAISQCYSPMIILFLVINAIDLNLSSSLSSQSSSGFLSLAIFVILSPLGLLWIVALSAQRAHKLKTLQTKIISAHQKHILRFSECLPSNLCNKSQILLYNHQMEINIFQLATFDANFFLSNLLFLALYTVLLMQTNYS